MKNLLKKIEELADRIEMGILTHNEAMLQLRGLRSEIADKFEEGSDEFIQCINPLIDANEIARTI